MNLGSSTRFVAQSVAVGLTAAVVLLFLLPRFAPREVVELVQAPAPAAGADRSSYAEAVAAARPAVVNVHAGRTVLERPNALLEDPMFRHFFGGEGGQATQRVETSLGSGVLVNARGYVLTNHHVALGQPDPTVGWERRGATLAIPKLLIDLSDARHPRPAEEPCRRHALRPVRSPNTTVRPRRRCPSASTA